MTILRNALFRYAVNFSTLQSGIHMLCSIILDHSIFNCAQRNIARSPIFPRFRSFDRASQRRRRLYDPPIAQRYRLDFVLTWRCALSEPALDASVQRWAAALADRHRCDNVSLDPLCASTAARQPAPRARGSDLADDARGAQRPRAIDLILYKQRVSS